MKTLNFLKLGIPAIIIFLFCSFNFSNIQDGIINDMDDAEWETCLREASGKIASSYAKSVLNVEYEYAEKDFKVKKGVKNPAIKNLHVKLIVHWTFNKSKYFVEGTLKTNPDCCQASWELTKSSSNMENVNNKLDLGCVAGSSTNARASMGVGRPFVRKKKGS